MLAVNHALFGATSALIASVYFDKPLFLPVLILVIFASIIPDIDHPKSELGKFFKPIAKIIPHRGITHSILGFGIFYYLINLVFNNYNQYFTYFLLFGCFIGVYMFEKISKKYILKIDNYSLGALKEKHSLKLLKIFTFMLYISFTIMIFLVYNNTLRPQMLFFITLGYVSHIIGDFVTIEGVPLFYPFKKKFGLKLFKVGGIIENILGYSMVIGFVYLIYQYSISNPILSFEYWTQYF